LRSDLELALGRVDGVDDGHDVLKRRRVVTVQDRLIQLLVRVGAVAPPPVLLPLVVDFLDRSGTGTRLRVPIGTGFFSTSMVLTTVVPSFQTVELALAAHLDVERLFLLLPSMSSRVGRYGTARRH
jgi:hypothetical protein